MSEFTEQRLSKLAKEYSIGVQHILDFLKGKGHVVDNNPNTKLSAELVSLVAKEFQSEKAKAQEAAKVTISHNDLHKDNVSLDANTKKLEPRLKEEKEDLIIKNVPAISVAEKEKITEKTPKKTPEPAIEKKEEKEKEEEDPFSRAMLLATPWRASGRCLQRRSIALE